MSHDPDGAEHQDEHDEDAKGEGQDVVRIVGRRGDVQEEHQVDTHLGNRQCHQGDGDARPIDDVGSSDPERGEGERYSQRQSQHVAAHALAYPFAAFALFGLVPWSDVAVDAHRFIPTR
jgi:hypothetical protein